MGMKMGMGMSMSRETLGGSGGKPYLGLHQQMKLSPRMRRDPLTDKEMKQLLTFTGITTTPQTQGDYNDAYKSNGNAAQPLS